METALQTTSPTPAMLIEKAVASGAGIEQLEKLMGLQERWEANEARKAYHVAMSRFKANPPKIGKDQHVEYNTSKGTTKYNHASLANVTTAINSELSKHGLTASWVTAQKEKSITVTCRITHEMGHFEETSLTSFPDESGGKNSIQAIGSAVTYLQRYTLLALTGLATHEQDDDGSGVTEFIADEQAKAINAKLTKLVEKDKGAATRFLKYMGVEEVATILAKDFGKAMTALKAVK